VSVSVVIAAPSEVTRSSLQEAMQGQAQIEVVGEAASSWHGGELLRALAPEVAVVDLALLSTCDFFLQGWGTVSRSTRIVVVGCPDPVLEHRLMTMGACACLSWDRVPAELGRLVVATASDAVC
jgi:DNA-binding NarL/FixJ family response regulator